MKREIVVATWNIGGAHTIASTNQFDYVDQENADYFIEELRKVQPDIVCLQESHANQQDSLSKRIQEALGLPHLFETVSHDSHIDPAYKNATAIISATPLSNERTVEIPYPTFKMSFPDGRQSARHQRYLQTVEAGPFMLANTHGNNIQLFGYDYDKDEGKDLATKIQEVYVANLRQPLIFAGDFNCDDVPAVFPELLSRLHLSNAVPPGATRPDGRRTDYLLYSSEIELLESQVVETNSDHYLCWATFRLPVPDL
jgi:endonuclease/exonuclease/phosphatase family metal-dependent hydrolase